MEAAEREEGRKNGPRWWGVARRPEVVLAGFFISLLLVVCFSGIGRWSAFTFSSQKFEAVRDKGERDFFLFVF